MPALHPFAWVPRLYIIAAKKLFYNHVRRLFRTRLVPDQVKGFEAFLDSWIKDHASITIPQLAYILASVWHETGARMVPVREGYATSDAQAYRIVTRLCKKRGRSNYARRNAAGKSFYGRGPIQLTFEENYLKIGRELGYGDDFVHDPDKVLEIKIGVEIAIVGMMRGVFTGKKLTKYINNDSKDYFHARRVVNILDKAKGIADYARLFERCLKPFTAYMKNRRKNGS